MMLQCNADSASSFPYVRGVQGTLASVGMLMLSRAWMAPAPVRKLSATLSQPHAPDRRSARTV
jgi:hypothetical protein